MKRSSATSRLWLLLAIVLQTALVHSAVAEPGTIEPREPRAQIRAEVLRATKIGSTPEDVLKFIGAHFKPKADVPAPKLLDHPAVGPTARGSEKKGVRSIRLVLGRYVANPGLLFMEIPVLAKTTTSVQWAFDEEGKLIEVFVDKDTESSGTQRVLTIERDA